MKPMDASAFPIPIPAHVPKSLVFDIDPFKLEGGNVDALKAWHKVQEGTPDLYYSPYCGGFWMANRAEIINEVLSDATLFSSVGGVTIMAMPKEVEPFPPLMVDPPNHGFFRQPLNLAMTPQKLQVLGARAREIIVELLDKHAAKGECEFMQDFALYIPVAIVMSIFEMPFEDSAILIPLADQVNRSDSDAERAHAIGSIAAYSAQWIEKRMANPGDDLVSQFLKVQVGERPISHAEVVSMTTVLLIGGLDSVSHSMGAIMRFLAENPDKTRELVEHPELINGAVDELLRRHSVASTARVVTKEIDFHGVHMMPGDRIFLCPWLYGLDARKFPDPMSVDFHRASKHNLAFGAGIHRCVGANLARMEIRNLLSLWLQRIPEFSIKPGETPHTMLGQTIATVYLPLVWPAKTPGL